MMSCPLIVSVQASPGAAVDHPETLWQMAKTSLDQGVDTLRLQGEDNIRYIRSRTNARIIGLIKRDSENSPIYITPSRIDVQMLIELGCEVIALDGTARNRPDKSSLSELVQMIHSAGLIAMGDCDCEESIRYALECGCDWIGTTLAGYTPERPATDGPDYELVRFACDAARSSGKLVIAEGRFTDRWQVEAALNIGATAVVVGGAINDPLKQTLRLMPNHNQEARIGAVDIGGTWLRFGLVENGKLLQVERVALPPQREERLNWIRMSAREFTVERIGVSTGGTVDPKTGVVIEAKPIIPEHEGSEFSERTLGVPTVALNDGLATALGHSKHPMFAGDSVFTLALGTGVGGGFVKDGKILLGPNGDYPRINDLPMPGGKSVEELLGGAALSPNPTSEQQDKAIQAFQSISRAVKELFYPKFIVVCGGVGLADWMRNEIDRQRCHVTPYGSDAGLYGAYYLANYASL